MSRAAFEARFPDEAACARHLAAMRWPDGFVCPACGHGRGWELKHRRASWECAACGKETSVSAGTVMHRSHLPLKTWFMAIHIVTSHSNGISALQLQAQLGLGSYKSAWLLLHKLRRAMVAPDRSLLEDLVEIDEATLPLRTKQEPPTGGQGRSPQGNMRIAGAVELSPEGEPRRIRLAPIGDFSACSLHAFVAGTSAPGARVITDGWSGYGGLSDHDHAPKIVGTTSAHLVLRWSHRVFSNLKRWALGTFHGLRRPHLRRYLDEFVFRWNRRRHTATAFDALLGIGTRLCNPPVTATSSNNAPDPGRPGASHRPPSDPPQLEPNTGPPACLTAIETNFPKSKSSRTSPGTVRKPCLERSRAINIWCDRKLKGEALKLIYPILTIMLTGGAFNYTAAEPAGVEVEMPPALTSEIRRSMEDSAYISLYEKFDVLDTAVTAFRAEINAITDMELEEMLRELKEGSRVVARKRDLQEKFMAVDATIEEYRAGLGETYRAGLAEHAHAEVKRKPLQVKFEEMAAAIMVFNAILVPLVHAALDAIERDESEPAYDKLFREKFDAMNVAIETYRSQRVEMYQRTSP